MYKLTHIGFKREDKENVCLESSKKNQYFCNKNAIDYRFQP